MKQAIKTGKPVLVAAETTPTVAVKAHPNGLLSMTSNVYPVRVQGARRVEVHQPEAAQDGRRHVVAGGGQRAGRLLRRRVGWPAGASGRPRRPFGVDVLAWRAAQAGDLRQRRGVQERAARS